MKSILVIIFISCSCIGNMYAQSVTSDKRHIYFYYISNKLKKNIILKKQFNHLSDSSLISGIQMILNDSTNTFDTIPCKYTNNSITFPIIDSSFRNRGMIYLSFQLNMRKKKFTYNERLTIPFSFILNNSNNNSDITITFERIRNNMFHLSISKVDFPFIVSTLDIPSEIIGLYRANKY